MAKYCLLFFLIIFSVFNETPDHNNGFESVDQTSSLPSGWSFQAPNYSSIKLDSITKYDGKYSLSIENSIEFNTPQEVGNYFYVKADETFSKEEGSIELRAFMKMDEIGGDYAGLWLKMEAEDGQLEFVDIKHV